MRKQEYDNSFVYALNEGILSGEEIKKVEEYKQAYEDKSDQYIMREIVRVKNDVGSEVLEQHLKNLDYLSKMEGFVTDEVKSRINIMKTLLATPSPKGAQQSNVESQIFFGGSSLLLWFLLLTGLFRRPFRRPIRRPF